MRISLSELLQSRDARQAKQHRLIEQYRQTVISLTLVMPGSEKRNELTAFMSAKATEAIRQAFGTAIQLEEEYDLPTGFEALYLISMDPLQAKTMACSIEDGHPMGRLFDIDIIGADRIPVSRKHIGCPPRKCLLCQDEAHHCMRSRKHAPEDIVVRIKEIIHNFKQSADHVSGI